MRPTEYPTPQGFANAMLASAQRAALERGVAPATVQVEFYLTELLAVLREADCHGWILKGGMALRQRHPGTRTTQDIDLHLHEVALPEAIERFRAAAHRQRRGHLLFLVDDRVAYRGGERSARLRVRVHVGRVNHALTVDLASPVRVTADPDVVQLRPVLTLPGHPELPAFALYPVVDQIADKLCAMYELHGRDGTSVSTRHHDLFDLGTLVLGEQINAEALRIAIEAETQGRTLVLPRPLRLPGDPRAWAQAYARSARGWPQKADPRLRTADTALEMVAACIEPILDGVAQGSWDPATQTWSPTGGGGR